ncbi:hypothetical protein ASPVEDRAFT_55145 [Aspergillus versicolor CBS 583.65]|uniref:Carboxylesterase type B domain-containing protein n=1 Tax=Aspergillus versicolor CBS 583.65 TaxID=1036611 RepID=A0A1L9PUE1_ASPVE|nr:uncharacterized protein ASPVEDRAFT_55145 [Aspergillus versicolor CBS 583.65]OJJ05157.1 hypothetical protein ASPVEDRAFT_55145 [Aspergillus versicolor CBS 583.65]
MSADCLTLRVDRPAGTPESAKFPVMVWIYGGGDTFGQIYDSAYDPTGLVLDHIATFGGDPDNVTIFGESDGATGVGLQITAYRGKQKAPFKRDIMQSGGPIADRETAGDKSLSYTKQLTSLVQCLRSIPMAKINSIAVAYEKKVGGNAGMGAFIPVAPSRFIPDSPSKLLATGRFSRNIDTLSGWNEDDGSFSTLPTLSSEEDVSAYLKYEYPALSNKTIKAAMALYPVSSFQDFPSENISAHYFRISQLKRDAEFTCASLYTVQMNHNQIILCEAYSAANVSYLGVSHFSDIPYVFNQASAEAWAPYAAKEDLRLSSEMSGSWTAFAKTGRPSAGNGTVDGWVGAFDSAGAGQDEYLRVISGPDSGSRKISNGKYGYDGLAARCAFWTSQEELDGMGV